MKKKDPVQFNYNRITPHIYLGTNVCCKTHFDKDLLKKGIVLDISLEGERVDHPYGVKYYLWLPTRDHTAPRMTSLWMGVEAMERAIDNGEKIYVHCKNGHGRGPTMVAAHLIYKRHMTAEEAVAYVQKRRPEIHLESSQRKRLEQFAKQCQQQ